MKKARYKKFFEVGEIISPNEYAFDMNGQKIRPGDIVYHSKFGKGQISRIDMKTYSIPMVIFEPFNSNEKIYRDAKEFSKFRI